MGFLDHLLIASR